MKLIDTKARGYSAVRVVKEGTRECRRDELQAIRSYKVDDSTQIMDKSMFLERNSTKDSLTLYLAQQLIDNSTVSIVTATRNS
jgi:hypothetical protein